VDGQFKKGKRMKSILRMPRRKRFGPGRLAAAAAGAGALTLLQMLPAHAQRLPPEDCLKPGEPLVRMPELVAQDGKLRGTIVLADERRRLTDATAGDCALQFLRFFRGEEAVAAASPTGTAAQDATEFTDPVPGPTLRARVGDIVQLTFLNQVDPLNPAGTLDRGDDAGACDQFSSGYPENVSDTFPNCFHGSSTANIHFHGTHTNPNSTGDNVFLHVRPSPRPPGGGGPLVTADSVETPFDAFFAECEERLKNEIPSGWPHTWSDLPAAMAAWTQEQKALLEAYDLGQPPYFPPAKPLPQQLWPENQKQLDAGLWPQYYVGASPFCFQLPEYTATEWPPETGHGLSMGQAPGIHWYHAHKHGSTTLNVSNGMTGAFIIEGKYDDDLNAFYGTVDGHPWTRVQPVLVINQLGGTPSLARGGFGVPQDFSVNGRLQPKLTMRPGEVQLWRIVNTASRGFVNLLPPTAGFEWKQLAQDGVQLADVHYQKSRDASVLMAPGNRVDLLVKAPMIPPEDGYDVMIQQTVSRTPSRDPRLRSQVLMSVEIAGNPPENMRQREFLTEAPPQPVFLADISDEEVRYSPRRTLTFDSKGFSQPMQHTINGEQFSDEIGVSVFLGTAEEWKVENTTIANVIDHPFHIHINPFQVVEVFDPHEMVRDAAGNFVNKYLLGIGQEDLPDPTIQCALDADDPDTWKDCHNVETPNGIWWDVFAIPSGLSATRSDGTPVTIPGYFRMRSRFVDYPGLYVLHCHILAHEDRGMMTIVEVRPQTSPVEHH
jgi:FtsP/CotA-like multicopper oxidase with cupredoxin domain